jgi:5-methylcytosine-specific restriction endonuclease McrA
MLADGRLHLSAVAKLAPHLTPANREALLGRAVHRTKREIEELIGGLLPHPDALPSIRKLPERLAGAPPLAGVVPASEVAPGTATSGLGLGTREGSASSAPQLRPDGVGDSCGSGPAPSARAAAAPPARVEPLAPARYKVQFTASAEMRDKLERLRALMRTSIPDGDLAAVIDAAVTEKLERLEARRFGKKRQRRAPGTVSPPPSRDDTVRRGETGRPGTVAGASRHLPAAVRRAVHERDGGQCRFVDERGRRCPARDGLEFHHRHPFRHGGGHATRNIALMCRAHNRHLAEIDYGREAVASRARRREQGLAPPASPPA